MRIGRPLLLVLLPLVLAGPALAQAVMRAPGEKAEAFADRALRLAGDIDEHVTEASWDGRPVVFVDFLRGSGDNEERPLIALLQEAPGGPHRRIGVTVGEEEGGTPDVAAIGFANADRDPAKELIVILVWGQLHGGGACQPIYEVRLFDNAQPGQAKLAEVTSLKRHFNPPNCRPGSEDGDRFRFKTIASVKAELKRMGF